MKCVAAGAHLATPCFLSLRNAQTIEPTTAWTAVSSPILGTRFYWVKHWVLVFTLEWGGARRMGKER